MALLGFEEQGHPNIQTRRDEGISNPGRLGPDQRGHVSVDEEGRAAQLQVAPAIEPGHLALSQHPPGLRGNPVRHDEATSQLARQTFGLSAADASPGLDGDLASTDLEDVRGQCLGRHGESIQRQDGLFSRTIRCSCGHEVRIPWGNPGLRRPAAKPPGHLDGFAVRGTENTKRALRSGSPVQSPGLQDTALMDPTQQHFRNRAIVTAGSLFHSYLAF